MKISKYSSNTQVLSEIGNRIKELRVSSNMKQAELSKRTGLSVKTISRIEQGENFQMDALISILREFNLIENFDIVLPEHQILPTEISDNVTTTRLRVRDKNKQNSFKWKDEI